MADRAGGGHANRRLRTRKDLLHAASRLSAGGVAPSMEAVAAEALVSRATAYRYFPNVEALLIEAAIDALMPEPQALFAADPSTDPAARLDRAETAMHERIYANELPLRLTLAQALQQAAKQDGDGQAGSPGGGVPLRQNRRTPLIEAALAPARDRFTPSGYRHLCQSLALVFGLESMVVFRDVLQVGPDRAREVKRWAIHALVAAALAEGDAASAGRPAGGRGKARRAGPGKAGTS